jgi:hypothetical protein
MLGRGDLGRLAPGAKADITVIDLSGLRTGPIEDPIRTLLMNGNGRDVKTVIVDGRTVVEDGAIPGLDVEAMRRRAQAYFDVLGAGLLAALAGRAVPADFPHRQPVRHGPHPGPLPEGEGAVARVLHKGHHRGAFQRAITPNGLRDAAVLTIG